MLPNYASWLRSLQDGHEDARKALYSKFDRLEFSDSRLYGIPIMGVDGLQGFMRVADVIADRYCKEHEYWEDTYLISEACERFGRDMVHAALAAHAKDNQNIQGFLWIHKIEKDKSELRIASLVHWNHSKPFCLP